MIKQTLVCAGLIVSTLMARGGQKGKPEPPRPEAMAITWCNAGSDAMHSFPAPVGNSTSPFGWTDSQTFSVISSASDQAYTGNRSIKFTGNQTSSGTINIVDICDEASRFSFRFRISKQPSTRIRLVDVIDGTFADTNRVRTFYIGINPDNEIEIYNNANNPLNEFAIGTEISANTWYRVTLAWDITSQTVNEIRIFVDGAQAATCTDVDLGTSNLTPTGVGLVGYSGVDTSGFDIWFDDMVVDDTDSLADMGDLIVTAKRPAANNTNEFDTNIGNNPSNRWENVNERPYSESNGWRQNGGDADENYTLETASQGDEDITGYTIHARRAWIICDQTGGGSPGSSHITDNGSDTGISITKDGGRQYFQITTATSSYPSNAAGIGIGNGGSGRDTLFYECGMLIVAEPPQVVQGDIDYTESQTLTLAGNVTFGGEVDYTQSHTLALTGGLKQFGAVDYTSSLTATFDGNVVKRGEVAYTNDFDITLNGSIIAGGSVAYTNSLDATFAGGVITSGAVAYTTALDSTFKGCYQQDLTNPIVLDKLGANDTVDIPSVETGTISPTPNSLLIVAVAVREGSLGSGDGTNFSISDTLTGTGSWTKLETAWQTTSAGPNHKSLLFYAKAGSNPGSGTITISHDIGGNGVRRWAVITSEMTAQAKIIPISESNLEEATSGTSHTNSLADVNSGNITVGIGGFHADTPTAGSGNTLLDTQASGGLNETITSIIYGTGTDKIWNNLTDTNAKTSAAIEVIAGCVDHLGNIDYTCDLTATFDGDVTSGTTVNGDIDYTNDLDVTLDADLTLAGVLTLTANLDVTFDANITRGGQVDYTHDLDVTLDADLTLAGVLALTANLDVTFDGDLTLGGSVDYTNDLDVTFVGSTAKQGQVDYTTDLDITFDANLTLAGAVDYTHDLDVTFDGDLTLGGSVAYTTDLDVTFAGDLTKGGAVDYTNDLDLTLDGDVTKRGQIDYTIDLDTTFVGSTAIQGQIAYTNDLDVTLAAIATFAGAVDYTNDLDVTFAAIATFAGAVDYINDLDVTFDGDLTLGGSVDYTHDLDVTLDGDVTLGGSVAYTTDLDSTFAGSLTKGGSVAYTNDLDLSLAGDLTLGGAIDYTIDVDITLDGDVAGQVNGNVDYTQDHILNLNGSVTFAGAIDYDNDLDITFSADVFRQGSIDYTQDHTATWGGSIKRGGALALSLSANLTQDGSTKLGGILPLTTDLDINLIGSSTGVNAQIFELGGFHPMSPFGVY